MEEDKGTSSSFQESVRLAFSKAKNDILHNANEITLFKSEITNLKAEIKILNGKIELMGILMKKQDEIAQLIKEKLELKSQINPPISTGTGSTGNERVLNNPEKRLVRQYRIHRPEIIRKRILELVPETGMVPVFSLYMSIVLKEQLCGKTTFYRYINELCVESILVLSLQDGQRILRKQLSAKIIP